MADQHLAGKMGAAIRHRGPDDAGVWASPELGLALAHRRLAVLDLSAAGHQPMHSVSGRYVIAFNGEIYNHLSLRRELDVAGLAPHWRGHADTETLLAAIEAWGLEAALQRCTGMWALAWSIAGRVGSISPETALARNHFIGGLQGTANSAPWCLDPS